MKRNVRTTKPKGVAFSDQKSRPVHQSRSETSVVKPSLHPWYYVKGRPDLIEKKISCRREREEDKHKQSLSNSHYFNKRLAETQVFDKWNDNKSLVKQVKHSNTSLKPPYDVIETKANPRLNLRANKELEKKYSKAKQKLTEFMHKFQELDQNCSHLEKRQNILVFQLKELRKIQTTVKEKTEIYEMVNKLLINNRFSRDKLRKKVFQIIDILNNYKIEVKKIQLLKNCGGVLSKEETTQLSEVIERGLKIIDLYIELNNNRNNEFQVMFDEEADDLWQSLEIEWQTEYETWNVMTEKLIQSFINIIKEKLSQLLAEETKALEERQQTLKELTEFTAKVKSDSQLSLLMTENMEHFLTEINENNS